MISLTTPLTVEKTSSLRAGDEVLLSGVIYTGRDAAHKRIVALHQQGKPLPFPLYDQTIFYVGPTPSKPGQTFGSGGPTTAGRMDAYAPTLITLGLRTMIGKGNRNIEVQEAILQQQGIYFGAIGGTGAIISQCVTYSQIIAFADLGPEAIRKLEIKDMPLVVIIDSVGNNLYEIGREKYITKYKEQK